MTAPRALLALLLASCAREIPAPPPEPVSLALARAAATRTENELLVRCDATLTNRTGQPLQVLSNFSSPFDGLSLVLLSEAGKEIARQAYVYHQSPYAEDGVFPLAPGTTSRPLVFPVDGLSAGAPPARARLEGGLRGTRFAAGLVSNEVRVTSDE